MRPDPSGQIQNFLNTNREYIIADIYTFVTYGGEVFRQSGYTVPFVIPGTMFDAYSVNAGTPGSIGFPLGPRFARSKITTKIGLQADAMTVTIQAGDGDRVGAGSYTWQNAFFQGVFDLAACELGRVVCQPSPGGIGAIVGHVVWFRGLVGDVEVGRTAVNVTVNSNLTLFSTQYPRRLWQPTCSHVFGDAGCQFDRQSMAVTVQAQAGSGPSTIITGVIPSPSTLYNTGTILGISGFNTGYKRTIADASSGTADLYAPFVYPVMVGDYFSMLPGCDHTINTCVSVFNNYGHFGGQPFIPESEFSI